MALGIPVYHIMEPEIREQIDQAVYEEEVGVAEFAMEEPEPGPVKRVPHGAWLFTGPARA